MLLNYGQDIEIETAMDDIMATVEARLYNVEMLREDVVDAARIILELPLSDYVSGLAALALEGLHYRIGTAQSEAGHSIIAQ